MKLAIGLMSGTSMDGIDATLIETDGETHIREIDFISLDYPAAVRQSLKTAEATVREDVLNFLSSSTFYPTSPLINAELWTTLSPHPETYQAAIDLSTSLHIEAAKKLLHTTAYKAEDIDVIGYHGQTLYHAPEDKVSIIIGNGKRMAQSLGITTINDFRSNDVAHGGKGAPLAPLYHLALAKRDNKLPIAVVNCGGISNITIINSPDPNMMIAYDTGPGNGLIDRLVRIRTNGKEHMDTNGKYGKEGKVHPNILSILYEKSIIKKGENFFKMPPPKALDINDMNIPDEINNLSLEDACRTLEVFTSNSIIESTKNLKGDVPKNWILAGGGWNNPIILQELQNRLQSYGANVITADEAGWNSKSLEAQIFAYLAVRAIGGLPLSFPSITGAPHPLSGGVVHPKPS